MPQTEYTAAVWKVALHLDEAQLALASALAHNVEDPGLIHGLYDRLREGQAILLEILRVKGLIPGSISGAAEAPLPSPPPPMPGMHGMPPGVPPGVPMPPAPAMQGMPSMQGMPMPFDPPPSPAVAEEPPAPATTSTPEDHPVAIASEPDTVSAPVVVAPVAIVETKPPAAPGPRG